MVPSKQGLNETKPGRQESGKLRGGNVASRRYKVSKRWRKADRKVVNILPIFLTATESATSKNDILASNVYIITFI